MPDLPTGQTLLALARDVLLNDLMPLLPEEARLDARLVANSMAIAEREAETADYLRKTITRNLEELYDSQAWGERPLRVISGLAPSRAPNRSSAGLAKFCGCSPSQSCAGPIQDFWPPTALISRVGR